MGKTVRGLNTNWLSPNSPGDVKDSIGNKVAKEHLCMTHDMDNGVGTAWGNGGEGTQQKEKIGTTIIAYIIKYNLNFKKENEQLKSSKIL